MRSFCIRVGPKPNDTCPCKREAEGDLGRPCDDRGQDCRDAATCRGTRGAPRSQKRWERCVPGAFRGGEALPHLDFGPLASRAGRIHFLYVKPRFVVIGFDSPTTPTPMLSLATGGSSDLGWQVRVWAPLWAEPRRREHVLLGSSHQPVRKGPGSQDPLGQVGREV